MHDLNSTQRDLIYIIAGLDAPHGLRIKDELDEYYGTDVNPGRLYPNLDTLVEMGLVAKKQADKRANAYTLTDRARRELSARRDWEAQYLDGLAPEDG